MSILEDKKLQELENKKYLTKLIQDYFNGKYEILNKRYQQKANEVLIDCEDIEELKDFYKDEFKKLNNVFLYPYNSKPKIFNSVAITDTNFTYKIEEILESIKDLLNVTLPNLEKTLKGGTPYSYSNLFTNLNITTAKVLLKHKLRNLKLKRTQDVENYEDIRPFREIEYFENFKTYISLHIIEPYLDYSYLFQRLKDINFIEKMTHKEFMEWLFTKGVISEKVYKEMLVKGGFNALSKCSAIHRVNNFNNIFGV